VTHNGREGPKTIPVSVEVSLLKSR
jgi:hypothetical protein